MDLHNMDAATVAQMMHKMNPQMLAHLGGQQGLEQMMQEMEKEEKCAYRIRTPAPLGCRSPLILFTPLDAGALIRHSLAQGCWSESRSRRKIKKR